MCIRGYLGTLIQNPPQITQRQHEGYPQHLVNVQLATWRNNVTCVETQHAPTILVATVMHIRSIFHVTFIYPI